MLFTLPQCFCSRISGHHSSGVHEEAREKDEAVGILVMDVELEGALASLGGVQKEASLISMKRKTLMRTWRKRVLV